MQKVVKQHLPIMPCIVSCFHIVEKGPVPREGYDSYQQRNSPNCRKEHHVQHPVELEEVDEVHPRERLVLHLQGIPVVFQITVDVNLARFDSLYMLSPQANTDTTDSAEREMVGASILPGQHPVCTPHKDVGLQYHGDIPFAYTVTVFRGNRAVLWRN